MYVQIKIRSTSFHGKHFASERERAAGTYPEPGIQMAGGKRALADIRFHPVQGWQGLSTSKLLSTLAWLLLDCT